MKASSLLCDQRSAPRPSSRRPRRTSARKLGVKVADVAGDVTTARRKAALAACPEPDILINNAGGPLPGDFRNWDRDDWIKAIDANMLTRSR